MASLIGGGRRTRFRPCRQWVNTRIVAYVPQKGSGIVYGRFHDGDKPDGLVVGSLPDQPQRKPIGTDPSRLRVQLEIRICGPVKPHRIDRINRQNALAILKIEPLASPIIEDGIVRCRVQASTAVKLRRKLLAADVRWE